MTNPRPEWVIYKNDQRIGQAVTWHKALDVLCKQEKNYFFSIFPYANLYQVVFLPDNINRFRIVKER